MVVAIRSEYGWDIVAGLGRLVFSLLGLITIYNVHDKEIHVVWICTTVDVLGLEFAERRTRGIACS